MSKRISKRKIKKYIEYLKKQVEINEKEAENLEYEGMIENNEVFFRLKGEISAAYYILNNC